MTDTDLQAAAAIDLAASTEPDLCAAVAAAAPPRRKALPVATERQRFHEALRRAQETIDQRDAEVLRLKNAADHAFYRAWVVVPLVWLAGYILGRVL
jgi:hypothetical protein